MRLRSVLEDFQSMPLSDSAECGHVGGLAEQMNRHDGARLARNDRFLDSRWIQQQRLWIYVYESQAEAAIERHGGAGDEGEVRNNDLATVIKTVMVQDRRQRYSQGICAVREQQAIAAAAIFCPQLRELLCQRLRQSFGAAHEYAAESCAHATMPVPESSIAVRRPRAVTCVADRDAAFFRQCSTQARRRWRQPSDCRAHQWAQPGFGVREQSGSKLFHRVTIGVRITASS